MPDDPDFDPAGDTIDESRGVPNFELELDLASPVRPPHTTPPPGPPPPLFDSSGGTLDSGVGPYAPPTPQPGPPPAFDSSGGTLDSGVGTDSRFRPSVDPKAQGESVDVTRRADSEGTPHRDGQLYAMTPEAAAETTMQMDESAVLSQSAYQDHRTQNEPPSVKLAEDAEQTDVFDQPSAFAQSALLPQDRGNTVADSSSHGSSALEHSLGTRRHKRPRPAIGAKELPALIGKYRPLRELGRGGMGIVYAAQHIHTERKVALKVLLARSGEDVDQVAIARFRVEARAAGRLKHPNIVAVLDQDLDPDSDEWYMAMELVEGESLWEKVSRDGPLEEQRAVTIVAELADGIAHAHSLDVLHRDLKPQNVLLDSTQDGTPLLTDFGLAKLVGAELNLTQAGPTLIGTPGFMPPEQAGTGVEIDVRADVYSLGSTLYYTVTGKAPFTGSSLPMVLNKVISKAPPKPSSLREGLSHDLETIILKCLHKEPKDRYPTAADLAADLRLFLTQQEIKAKRQPPLVRFQRWAARNVVASLALASALLVAVVALGFAVAILATQERARQAVIKREQRVQQETKRADDLAKDVAKREETVAEEVKKLESIPPQLEVQEPPPSETPIVVAKEAIDVRLWIPDDDVASVTFAGQPVESSAEASAAYLTRWTLEEGTNVAAIIATDEHGNVTESSLTVIRDTTAPEFDCAVEAATLEVESDAGTVSSVRVVVRLASEEDTPPTATLAAVHSAGASTDHALSPVPAAEEGDGPGWEATVPLELGTTTLRIVVTDALGNARTLERTAQRLEPTVLRGTWWPLHPAQGAFAMKAALPVQIKGYLDVPFVLIPPGAFEMGSPPDEKGRGQNEFLHPVELTQGFYLSATEVTNGQFRQVFPAHHVPDASGTLRYGDGAPWGPVSLDADDAPAAGVTWEQAAEFCRRLGELEGHPGRYRLPTEAEWEYACRAGARTRWYWGDDVQAATPHANVAGDQARGMLGLGNPPERGTMWFPLDDGEFPLVAPVRSFQPNPFGLYDMVGNVAEWCADFFGAYAIRFDDARQPFKSLDPKGPTRAPRDAHVFRGGGWRDRPGATRSAARMGVGTSKRGPYKSSSLGFRVVRVLIH